METSQRKTAPWGHGRLRKGEPHAPAAASALADALAAWEAYARTTARDNPEGARLARRTAEALRLEQADGIPRCTCCLLPLR